MAEIWQEVTKTFSMTKNFCWQRNFAKQTFILPKFFAEQKLLLTKNFFTKNFFDQKVNDLVFSLTDLTYWYPIPEPRLRIRDKQISHLTDVQVLQLKEWHPCCFWIHQIVLKDFSGRCRQHVFRICDPLPLNNMKLGGSLRVLKS